MLFRVYLSICPSKFQTISVRANAYFKNQCIFIQLGYSPLPKVSAACCPAQYLSHFLILSKYAANSNYVFNISGYFISFSASYGSLSRNKAPWDRCRITWSLLFLPTCCFKSAHSEFLTALRMQFVRHLQKCRSVPSGNLLETVARLRKIPIGSIRMETRLRPPFVFRHTSQ